MKKNNKIINISPTLFLNSLPQEKHAEVKTMFEDPAIHQALLLIENEGNRRQVIAIGPDAQYKDASTIEPDSFEGMRTIAIVDATKPYPDLTKVHSPRQHNTVPIQSSKLKSLNNQTHVTSQTTSSVAQLEAKIKELKRAVAEESGKVMLREQTILELQQRIEQIENKQQNEPELNTLDDSMLTDREQSVLKAEEDLINRLTYLMEKEAELEQFEENLNYRERMLNEREGEISTPQA
jgi:hypothetical protein